MVDLALGIANLPWVVSTLSNTQSLTHVAVDQYGYFHLARQYCMVAHPCPKTSQLTDCRSTLMTN